jgi:hypothetical protein
MTRSGLGRRDARFYTVLRGLAQDRRNISVNEDSRKIHIRRRLFSENRRLLVTSESRIAAGYVQSAAGGNH